MKDSFKVPWPMRFRPLTGDQLDYQILYAVIAYQGGKEGFEKFLAKQNVILKNRKR